MSGVDTLLAAAAEIDVIDAAGRIIANPKRNAIAASAATVVALASATERFWAVCVEADLLVRALKLPMTGNHADEDFRDHAIQTQSDTITRLMTAMRGETATLSEQETDHASSK